MTTPTGPIIVLGTGGTISCTHADNGDLRPTYTTAELVAQADITAANVECRDIMQLDSSNITLTDIDALVAAIDRAITDGAAGIILLHGTDSLEETAMAIHRFFTGSIPIAITGAQRPADDPNPDGPENLRAAFAALDQPEVMVVFGGEIMNAYGTTKRHTTEERAFANTYLGNVPERLPRRAPLAGLTVAIVTTYAGADAGLIPTHLDGLVIAAMGSGNVPSALADALPELGYPVTICTRVPEGAVHFIYGGTGGGASLERLGVRSGGSLRPTQARMEMLCQLAVDRAG